MTNIIRFPNRHAAPPPARNVLDELTTLEIALARARLAQIRSETRQMNALWFWYCLKRVLFWGVVLWLVMGVAKAEPSISRSFHNERGSFAGSSVKRGNHTSFYDSQGRFSGSSVDYGRSKSFYGPRGNFTGSSINTGPRR
jgi:hypothetical protein